MRRTPRRVAALSVLVVVALATAVGVTGPAAAAPKFPTWSEVEKAMHNVSTKRAEVAKLKKLLGSLQGQASAAGKLAAVRGEEYLNAKSALDAATKTASTLEAQSTTAKKRADQSSAEAGALSAQLARQGDGDLTLALIMSGHKAGNLLDVLGTMTKLSQSAELVFTQASQDRKAASALSAQATIAEKARAGKAKKASSALTAAKAASQAATDRVTAANKTQGVLTAQLATLEGVSKKTLAAYYDGVAWEKKQEAQKTPPPDPPSTGGGDPGAPNASKVDGAITFARAQLGKPYVLDGAGPNVWDCSGLTLKSYAAVGIYIGTHSATNQYNTLRAEGKLVPLSQRQAGDLVWYSDGGSTSAIKYHVALYIGGNEMIEAPYPGVGVRIAALRYGDLVPYAGRPTG